MTPPRLLKLPVDAFARREHYLDHIAPVWLALKEKTRGKFYVPAYMEDYARAKGLEPSVLAPERGEAMNVWPRGLGPLLVAAYGDMVRAIRHVPQRPILFMEHGVGLTFGDHPGYAGGGGTRKRIDLFLNQNQHTHDLNKRAFPRTPGVVIGTPKFDSATNYTKVTNGKKPVVCVSFHWNGEDVAPEAGNAFKHYMKAIPELAKCKEFKLIGHGHPRYRFMLASYYYEHGIEAVWDFEEVLRRADVYMHDSGSTLYEFCITGKPVVILNAPEFRRDKHWGIRFWDYSDIGPMVDDPADLMEAIKSQVEAARGGADPYAKARQKAVRELYPYRGRSAKRAARAIEEFTGRKLPQLRKIRTRQRESVGIIYMAFGEPAVEGVMSSVNSLRRLGLDVPVCIVGDTPIEGTQFIKWPGESPFDPDCAKNFQFRAGRVKPGLCALTPFERTLYIDADTEFMSKQVLNGWRFLDDHDMALARELLEIGQLYNKPRAGWEINIKERNATIVELGGDKTTPFLNSGVIFFRKNRAVKRVFRAWGEAWQEWQQWDEQLSLMRAMYRVGRHVKVKQLDVDWNHPHRDQAGIIFHNYGRGPVRSNVEQVKA